MFVVVSSVNVSRATGFLTLPIDQDVIPTHFFQEPGYETHLGTDWPMPEGNNIVAPYDALVEFVYDDNVPNYSFGSGIRSFGNYIKLDLGAVPPRSSLAAADCDVKTL